MGAPQFATQVDNSTTNKKVFTEAEVTANSANQWDIDAVSEDVSSTDYSAGETNISGAQALNGMLTEASGSTASVIIEWTDGAGTVLGSQTVATASNGSDDFAVRVKSTHANVKITGSSTDASLTGNAN